MVEIHKLEWELTVYSCHPVTTQTVCEAQHIPNGSEETRTWVLGRDLSGIASQLEANMALPVIPLIGAISVILLTLYRFLIFPVFISPLSKVPAAHWSATFSPIWILWTRFQMKENKTLHAAHERLGSVIRVGPSELSVNDLNGLRTVYAGGFEKGQWYSIFDNYGWVVPCICLPMEERTDGSKCTMHVLIIAIPHPFRTKTHDLTHLLQISPPRLQSIACTSSTNFIWSTPSPTSKVSRYCFWCTRDLEFHDYGFCNVLSLRLSVRVQFLAISWGAKTMASSLSCPQNISIFHAGTAKTHSMV